MKQRKASIENIAVLLVFCLLALCLLMTLLMGARIYRSVAERGEENYDRRTVSQYITSRVRQSDARGKLFVEDFAGVCALSIEETIDGRPYLTRIYCHEGWLCELFAAEGSALAPEDGEKLLRSDGISFLLEEDLLTVCTENADGSSATLMLHLRNGKDVLP